MKKILFLIAACWLLATPHGQAQDEDVMFQAFDWNVQNQPPGQTWYRVLQSALPEIADAGIDMMWMPPSSDSGDDNGYLPRELYNLTNKYGTRAQLEALLADANRRGVRMLADIVVNHRVGTPDAVTFTNPAWPTWYITADDEGRNFVDRPVDFSINGDFWPGTRLKADNSPGSFSAARDLDHENPAVRDAVKEFLALLRQVGFSGWRYDFTHGYNPIYNKEYNDASRPYFAVAELLESSRVQLNNWLIDNQFSSSIFDFNTKVSLQNALRDNNLSYLRDFEGRPSGLIGWNAGKSVTFLENHDTGPRQVCCGIGYTFPGDEASLRKGYAYILTHPGVPMVFWSHFFDAAPSVRQAIKDMIAIRKDVRVFAGSGINIDQARNDLYAAYIDGRNGTIAMKIGPGSWSPFGNGWTLRTSGSDYAIWTQGGGGSSPPINTYSVYFRRPASGWGNNVNVYAFDRSTNTQLAGTQAWPGQPASGVAGSPWFRRSINVPGGTNPNDIGLVFNDGQGNQSTDLFRGSEGWFTPTGTNGGQVVGTWSATCPANCPTGRVASLGAAPPQLRAYPNPFGKSITVPSVVGWGDAPTQVAVYDLAGNQVLVATRPGNKALAVETKGLRQGVYLLRLRQQGKPDFHQKIMKK